jgi:uncharacterized membrane protein YdjX (TVP38/TMEM64 family)
MKKSQRNWIGLAVAVIGLFVIARLLPIADWLRAFNEWIRGVGPVGMLVYAALYAAATVLMLPGWILTVGAGIAFGLFRGTVVVSIGATIGAALAFLIARYVAREAVARRFEGNEKFKAVDRAIGEQGWKIVGLLRLSPVVPFNLSNYFYGLTAVRFWPYVLASWIGMLPGTLLYVYLGVIGKTGLEAAAGTQKGRSPLEYVFLGVGLLATVIVTVYVTKLARSALKNAI